MPRTLWLGLGVLLIFLALAYLLSLAELTRQQTRALPVIGPVADFTLTNQDGKTTTLADLTNHVWVADIIFTRCAGPCPIITGHMKSLEDALPTNGEPRLVTLTTDPDFDTPAVMKNYGERFGADFSRWMFLTGTKAAHRGAGQRQFEIERRARAGRGANQRGGFVHSQHDFCRGGQARAAARLF